MEKYENFFERLAHKRNITVEKMKQIISDRIEQGLCDPDPEKRKSWEAIPCEGDADEALTGTKDSRTEFQKLLTECKAGNIDLIITKSISRFARNTVTLLETVRELKRMRFFKSPM